jgi:hypothetical protein
MKHIKFYISALLLVLVFSGCEEENFLEIDSISAMGDEFFFGQKVKVWAAVKTDNLPSARYYWTCEGGRLTQPQGLDENTWEAPRVAGNYRIHCEVDVNGTKKSRWREMWVSSYYFEKFERTSHTFTQNSSTMTVRNGRLETRVNSTTATRGFIQRAFGDSELKVPVSSKTQIGWISNFPSDPITIGNNTAQNTLYYEWTLNRDPDREDNLYIDNIRFEWYPVGRAMGLPLDPEEQPYNGYLRYQQRNATNSVTTPFMVYVNHPALTFAQNQYKKVSLSLDTNYIVHVYVDGQEIFTTDAIKNWRSANNSKDDIYVNQWRINYCSNRSGQSPPLIHVDDAYFANDGTILK